MKGNIQDLLEVKVAFQDPWEVKENFLDQSEVKRNIQAQSEVKEAFQDPWVVKEAFRVPSEVKEDMEGHLKIQKKSHNNFSDASNVELADPLISISAMRSKLDVKSKQQIKILFGFAYS